MVPSGATAMPPGLNNPAASAAPPSPLWPCVPLPAIVLTMGFGVGSGVGVGVGSGVGVGVGVGGGGGEEPTARRRLFPPSEMMSDPLWNATDLMPKNVASIAGPPSPLKPNAPVPANGDKMPDVRLTRYARSSEPM